MTREADLRILNALAQALSHSLDLDRVLHAALDTVAELLRLETGWVWLLDETTGAPRLAAARDLPAGLRERPELMEGTCLCLTTYEAGDLRGAANVNVVWCTRLARLVSSSHSLRCHASIPLYADDRKLGILNVASPDWRELTPDELDLLYTVGSLVSLAVERTRLAARGAQLAAVEERNRLAREIHDTLAQSLSAIVMQLESADALLESRNAARAGETVRRALGLTRATLDEARRSVLELRARPLAGRGLVESLRALADELRRADPPLDVAVRASGLARPDALPPAVELGLYHVAREALTNVVRHAGATRAAVHVERRGDRARLRVVDDGVGMDAARVPDDRFGLVGMRERARLLGGTLRVARGADGRGTSVSVAVPLRASRSARSARSARSTRRSA